MFGYIDVNYIKEQYFYLRYVANVPTVRAVTVTSLWLVLT